MKRFLSAVLIFVMLLSAFPLTAFAAEEPDLAPVQDDPPAESYKDEPDLSAYYLDADGNIIQNENGGVFCDPTDDQLRAAGWSVTRAGDEKDFASTGYEPDLASSGSGNSLNDPFLIDDWNDFEYAVTHDGTFFAKVTKNIKFAYDWDNERAKPVKVTGNINIDLNGCIVEKYLDDQWDTRSGIVIYDGFKYGFNRMLEISGTLTVNDTAGSGILRTYAYIDADTNHNEYAECACAQGYPVTVLNGGRFVMNNGMTVASRKKDRWVVQGLEMDDYHSYSANVWTGDWLRSEYVDFRNNGTALTVKYGGEAIINNGEFIGGGWKAKETYDGEWKADEGRVKNMGGMHAAVDVGTGGRLYVNDGYFRGDCANVFNVSDGADIEIVTGFFRTSTSDYTVVGCDYDPLGSAYDGFWIVAWNTKNKYGCLGLPESAFTKGRARGAELHYYTYDGGAVLTDYDPNAKVTEDLEFGPVSPYGNIRVVFDNAQTEPDGNVAWAPGKSVGLTARGVESYFPYGSTNPDSSENWQYIWQITDTSYYNPSVLDQPGGYDYALYKSSSNSFNFDYFSTSPSSFTKSAGFNMTPGHVYSISCYVVYEYDSKNAYFKVDSNVAGAVFKVKYSEIANPSIAELLSVVPTYNRVYYNGSYYNEYTVYYNMTRYDAEDSTALMLSVIRNVNGVDANYWVKNRAGNFLTVPVYTQGEGSFSFVDYWNTIDIEGVNDSNGRNRFRMETTTTNSAGNSFSYFSNKEQMAYAWITTNRTGYTAQSSFISNVTVLEVPEGTEVKMLTNKVNNDDTLEWVEKNSSGSYSVVSENYTYYTVRREGSFRVRRTRGGQTVYSNEIRIVYVSSSDYISEVNFPEVPKPIGGMKAADCPLAPPAASSNYSVTKSMWQWTVRISGVTTIVNFTGTFVEDGQFYATYVLTPATGKHFSDSVTVNCGGTSKTFTPASDGTLTIRLTVTAVGSSSGYTVSGMVDSYLSETEKTLVYLQKTGTEGFPSVRTITGTHYYYTFNNIPPGRYSLTFKKKNHVERRFDFYVEDSDVHLSTKINPIGDANGDGEVTTLDYAQANAHAKGVRELSGYAFACANVAGGDDVVTTIDAAAINAHAKGARSLWS